MRNCVNVGQHTKKFLNIACERILQRQKYFEIFSLYCVAVFHCFGSNRPGPRCSDVLLRQTKLLGTVGNAAEHGAWVGDSGATCL